VYTDAKSLAEQGTMVGKGKWSPAGWALCSFLFLIIFLPLYLYERAGARRAAASPRMMADVGFCTSCGEALPGGAAFCARCGLPAGLHR
jgi:hypothetical protein